MEIAKPFLNWQDCEPRVEMMHFVRVSNLFRGIEKDFNKSPETESFDYHYAGQGDEGDVTPEILTGVDRKFLFGLWLMRDHLYQSLAAANRQDFADRTLGEIDARYKTIQYPIKIPVRSGA